MTLSPFRISPPVLYSDSSAPGAIRTRNLRIRSPTLYPIELRGQSHITEIYKLFYHKARKGATNGTASAPHASS